MRRNAGRWTGVLLSIILVSNCGINVQATGKNNVAQTEEVQEELTPEQQYEKELQDAYDKKVETNEIKGWPQGARFMENLQLSWICRQEQFFMEKGLMNNGIRQVSRRY